MSKKRELYKMSKLKCANPDCNEEVDALHMDDDGYCDDCHNKIIDGLQIEESDETRFLSDESLRIMCLHPIRVRPSRPSID
jgi:hypothetical protein